MEEKLILLDSFFFKGEISYKTISIKQKWHYLYDRKKKIIDRCDTYLKKSKGLVIVDEKIKFITPQGYEFYYHTLGRHYIHSLLNLTIEYLKKDGLL
jgi:hypothetical protein